MRLGASGPSRPPVCSFYLVRPVLPFHPALVHSLHPATTSPPKADPRPCLCDPSFSRYLSLVPPPSSPRRAASLAPSQARRRRATPATPTSASCPTATAPVPVHPAVSTRYVFALLRVVPPLTFPTERRPPVHRLHRRRCCRDVHHRRRQPVPPAPPEPERLPAQDDLLHVAQLHQLWDRDR